MSLSLSRSRNTTSLDPRSFLRNIPRIRRSSRSFVTSTCPLPIRRARASGVSIRPGFIWYSIRISALISDERSFGIKSSTSGNLSHLLFCQEFPPATIEQGYRVEWSAFFPRNIEPREKILEHYFGDYGRSHTEESVEFWDHGFCPGSRRIPAKRLDCRMCHFLTKHLSQTCHSRIHELYVEVSPRLVMQVMIGANQFRKHE